MNQVKGKIIIPSVGGILATAYGMIEQNDAVFIIGILLMITGYLFLRKELRKRTKDKTRIP